MNIHDIINLWVPSCFALLAAVALGWATYTEHQATRFIKPGSIWKKKHGTTAVVVTELDLDSGMVSFRYQGFAVHVREMAWTSFLSLYELESMPYEASQAPIKLEHVARVDLEPTFSPEVPKSQGQQLDALADLLGMERRWWGLEPDWLFARRLFKGMKP